MDDAGDYRENPGQQLDQLCKHLTAAKSYAVLSIVDGDTAQLHGVAVGKDFEWQVADIPELVPLTEHFDRILVRSDGYSLEVICIKNRLGGGGDQVTISIEQIRQIGKECLKYTGKVQGTRLPVAFRIWEVTDSAKAEVDHLRQLRCIPGTKKVAVTSWTLNLSTGAVWTNTRFNGLFSGRKVLEQTLRKMATGESADLEGQVEIGTDIRFPVMTYGLVGLIGVFFIIQLVVGEFAGLLSPTVGSLVAFGGLHQPAVINDGQWYRLFTAAFLHGGLFHIVLNGLALYLGGILLESWLGRAWFLTIFALSILGGSVASLLINDPNIVSVGASGAIMGVLATAFMVTFRLPYGQERTSAMMNLMYWLVPALIPIATNRSGGKIDFAAHFGGAIVGFILGAIILKTWASDQRLPRFGKLATVVAGIGGILICLSIAQAISNRGDLQEQLSLSAHLAKDEVFQGVAELKPEEAEIKLANLRKDHPRDPRSQYFSALYAVEKNQVEEAKQYLQHGLAETDILETFFTNGKLEVGMRVLLVQILLHQRVENEAKDALKPICGRFTDEDVKRLDATWIKTVCNP